MQASNISELMGEHKNLKGKSIYYLCDLHSSQSSIGKRYDELVRTYQVTFCSYTVFPGMPDYLNSFSMRHNITGALFSDAIHVIYVELSKLGETLKKPVVDMTDLEKWSVFFRYANVERYRKLVNNVIESKEALLMASELLMTVSKDEREQAIFRSQRKFQSDMDSNLATAEKKGELKGIAIGEARGEARGIAIGEAKGIAIGEAKGIAIGETRGEAKGKQSQALAIARNALQMNMPIDDIAKLTGLTPEEVEGLRA
jgi:predicted transposase/invertase (TIGR01784 family)